MMVPVLLASDSLHVIWEGKTFLFFGGYDYHRLSRHPEILRAVEESIQSNGLSSGGARITTGTHPLHIALEARLSKFFGTAATAVLPAGYLANLALLDALSGENYLCYFHPDCHPSLKDAIRMSGLPKIAIPSDPEELSAEIAWNEKRPLIISDGVYGTLPPLPDYLRLAERFDGLLIIDEAHALGILGKRGRGAAEHFFLKSPRIILSGSLGKALGAAGGFVSGPKSYIDAVLKTCAYGTTSALSLPLAAAAIAALDYLDANAAMMADFRKRCVKTKKDLNAMGYNVPVIPTPVIGISMPDAAGTDALKNSLIGAGIYPSLIRYPGKNDYFRFALSSRHGEEHISRLIEALRKVAGN
ncbi:MAG: pyridoxal phosphate-dependent aminotransferase family protein [bacterium]|jgi:7-keto-8-aminopelargonate synthetase-like enzyme|nr:pyridoxal phosphate-dependent aminotransferase family protein [Candidatus Neomarinimicrobiota bacterium]MDX9780199.1 pyridoxal phosphate-dependent aminotransferase family protein [bacterium]